MLTNLFITLGWTRDDWRWLWTQVLSVALLITSGIIDVPYWAGQLGIPLSTVGLHWVQVLCIAALWVSGKYDSSSLPGRKP
jgi:hypothetical protein